MSYQYWSNEDLKVLQDNYNSLPTTKIAEKLHRSTSAVEKKACALGLSKPKPWSKDDLQYLTDHYMDQTNREIACALGRTKVAVGLKINKLGLHKSPYHYNATYFHDIDTQDKAYWLGFFYADGCVTIMQKQHERSYEACIKLQGKDGGHLRKFNACLDGNVPVQYSTRKSVFDGSVCDCASIRLYSKQIVNDLISHGCAPRKSFDIKFPNLPPELMRHFIRGFFDGDGCFCRDSKPRNTCAINFCSASEAFLDGLRATIYQRGVSSYIVNEANRSTSRLYVRGMENCDRMLTYMYDGANCFLDRKYWKAIRFYEENQIAQRLLRRSVMSGFYFNSEKENGKPEMVIRVEGCEQNLSHTQSVEVDPV